jgi:hypothetical protein
MEHQNDIYVSILRKFVTAMGGKLKLGASFPDREVVINQQVILGALLRVQSIPACWVS